MQGTTAPTIPATYLGQTYLNVAKSMLYVAKGINTGATDWNLVLTVPASGAPEYANNAAATFAGLSVGQIYRTVSASCVFYEGPNLVCSGVKTNDTLETVIKKIDAMVCKGGQMEHSGTSGTSGSSGSSGTSGTSSTSGHQEQLEPLDLQELVVEQVLMVRLDLVELLELEEPVEPLVALAPVVHLVVQEVLDHTVQVGLLALAAQVVPQELAEVQELVEQLEAVDHQVLVVFLVPLELLVHQDLMGQICYILNRYIYIM
ncbi:hypothetical protein GHT06_007261 [Daphnia sinensis]|uniref:Uncharacterized protein n=1 Tax=Daphnia sinensis TaxID=1820382 RepID=A0AAD5PL46_9CRUS|nr:hypothetical protein GHT06_007261 [Daphnia sinensis]